MLKEFLENAAFPALRALSVWAAFTLTRAFVTAIPLNDPKDSNTTTSDSVYAASKYLRTSYFVRFMNAVTFGLFSKPAVSIVTSLLPPLGKLANNHRTATQFIATGAACITSIVLAEETPAMLNSFRAPIQNVTGCKVGEAPNPVAQVVGQVGHGLYDAGAWVVHKANPFATKAGVDTTTNLGNAGTKFKV